MATKGKDNEKKKSVQQESQHSAPKPINMSTMSTPAPPGDPPDIQEIEQQQKKPLKMITHDSNIEKEKMVITPTKVEMIATPEVLYKIVRVVNHFIHHIIDNHSDEAEDITKQSLWFIKWKAVYPVIKSSRRTIIEVYRILFNDYSLDDKDINLYGFMMELVDIVPHLKMSYDILKAAGNTRVQSDRFQLHIYLYNGTIRDASNPFHALEESSTASKFKPFTDSRSITTWHTIATKSMNNPIIPSDVTIDKSNKVPAEETSQVTPSSYPNEPAVENQLSADHHKASPLTDDSNLSFSENSKMVVQQKQVRFTRNQQLIKEQIKETFKEGINGLESSLKSIMLEQNNTLKSILQSTMHTTPPTPMPSSTLPSSLPTPVPSSSAVPPSVSNPAPTSNYHHSPLRFGNSQAPRSAPSPQYNPQKYGNNNHMPQFQKSGTLIFSYEGEKYELRDSHFHKNSAKLRTVKDKVDLIHFYEELQSDAISYNIFLKQFDMLVPWVKYASNTLPPTCLFEYLTIQDNTIDAYNRMKNCLYTKISKAEIKDPEYSAIIKHGSIGKDGFEVLYELMTHCHPKLSVASSKIRDTNKRPELDSQESIYEYAERLTTWLTIEQIEGLVHNDDQILNIVMEEMRKEDKYDQAVQSINSELTINDTMYRQTGHKLFPEALKLYHLPSTIMSYYSKEDKNLLFPTDDEPEATISKLTSTDALNIQTHPAPVEMDDITDIAQAIVRATYDSSHQQSKFFPTREGVDEICEGCGLPGHNTYKTGCDRCAQFILVKQYLEKNPDQIRSILAKYRKHQKEKLEMRRSRRSAKSQKDKSNNKPKHRYNTRYNKAKVQALHDVMQFVMNSESEDDASFVSAASSDKSPNTSEQE